MVQNTNNGGQSTEFVYNAEGKRVVYFRNGQKTRYLYDGWNVLGEYDTANMLKKSYLWGSDLSSSEQGATQQSDFRNWVGGLLACRDVSQNSVADDTGTGAGASFYYHYDGNGNVTKLTDASGNIRASYDYSPFGKVIAQSGDYADENKYRFSTKPYEKVSETFYYGFRFYDAGVGRFTKRDPIFERGGVNLFSFLDNDSINYVDLYGLAGFECCDSDKRGEGKKKLDKLYKKALDYIKKNKIKNRAGQCKENSIALNSYFTPAPDCWACNYEHRKIDDDDTWQKAITNYSDHAVVTCIPNDEDGNKVESEEIIYDIINKTSGDKDDVNKYRKKYPVSKSTPTSYPSRCGTRRPQKPNLPDNFDPLEKSWF